MTPTLRLLIPALLLLALPAWADPALDLLERVAAVNAELQPGLERYQVTVHTNKLGQMLQSMTANMPPDLPRPQPPVLRKYWTRDGGTLIRAEGAHSFPYMQQMVERFSAELAIDLRTLLLPPQRAEDRRRLLATAQISRAEHTGSPERPVSVQARFSPAAQLDGAFYGAGLDLPQNGIESLTFEIDPAANLLRGLQIVSTGGVPLNLAIRYQTLDGAMLPEEIHVSTFDGSIHEWLQTTFTSIDGYQLPSEQLRRISHPARAEEIAVEFRDYRVNKPFPEDVEQIFRK